MRLRPPPPQPDPLTNLEKLLRQPEYEEIPLTVLPHAKVVPLGVMVRGTLERILDDQVLDSLIRETGSSQYTRALTISCLVKLLIQVSAGVRGSVFAAYKADQNSDDPLITTSYQALYGKLKRFDPAASEALVRYSASNLEPVLERMPPAMEQPLPGYRLRILDGNVLTGTDHRLTALRKWLNACLPGKSLVVYEPGLGLVADLVLCEDAYTQERALLTQVLPRACPNDLWVADRNFCTTRFVFGMVQQQASFIVRRHRSNLPCTPLGRLRKCGKTATGTVYERRVEVVDPETGKQQTLRKIELRLFEKTRDGERTLMLFTNLPETITALEVVEIYRKRWTIEKHFHFLTESLHCEVKGLGNPRASLLMFAMALVAGNALAMVRGAMRQAHGTEAEAEVSGYYLADEIGGDYKSLTKYMAPQEWIGWRNLTSSAFASLLTTIAAHVRITALTKSKRGPKRQKAEKPVYNKKHKHFSTARLLEEGKNTC